MSDQVGNLRINLPQPLTHVLRSVAATAGSTAGTRWAARCHRHQPYEARLTQPGPAEIIHDGDRIMVYGHRFSAVIQPESGALDVFSEEALTQQSFDTVLRVAVSCHLPFLGGIPLHAAGVAVRPDLGVAFFGVSGAGKSTLASLCPRPVLSDELVLIHGRRLFASGFWGTAPQATLDQSFPMGAFVEIKKGETFSLTPMSADLAFRRMISVVQVPTHGPTWSRALTSLHALTREAPAYVLTYSKESNPWPQIEDMFARVA